MYAGIDPKNASKAEKAILREFKSCIDGDVSEEEITNAKKTMIDDLLTTEDSVYAMETFWLRSSLLDDERTPCEVASAIKNADGQRIVEVAKGLVPSVTYLLTGMEGTENERRGPVYEKTDHPPAEHPAGSDHADAGKRICD